MRRRMSYELYKDLLPWYEEYRKLPLWRKVLGDLILPTIMVVVLGLVALVRAVVG